MTTPTKLIFLPGAGGSAGFWEPVSELLLHPASRTLLGWPGFGPEPVDRLVTSVDDLVNMVVSELDQPSALIAQSMGGAIALQAALRRLDRVTHLVLAVTSGGIDISGLGAEDWRPAFQKSNPSVPRWFIDYKLDLSSSLGLIRAPTLLLWGDADPISPVAVGERLGTLLPHARMHVFAGGQHDLANTLAHDVASQIDAHLSDAD
ncbi:MAG: alpha/beta fold hydrolase [Burkholderiales bacterium]|nr:alpha/beta fold hydrolase [Burkholderiales bacterium]